MSDRTGGGEYRIRPSPCPTTATVNGKNTWNRHNDKYLDEEEPMITCHYFVHDVCIGTVQILKFRGILIFALGVLN